MIKSFVDHDGVGRRAGEMWTFTGSNFLPYDDGRQTTGDDGRTRHIRPQWRPDEQEEIMDALENFVAEATDGD